MPLHSSSPPPLDDDDDDDDDGEVGSEEDVFGDFGGFSAVVSCSSLGFAHSSEPPSSLRQPSPTTKPATHQPHYSFIHLVEKSQTTSNVEGQACNAGSSLHLANGYAERAHESGSHYSASVEGACSPKEELGFADFTVFTDQAAHPWCCGFSPIASTQQWDGKVEGMNMTEKSFDPGQEIMEAEPQSHCALMAKEDVCTRVKQCEKRDPALEEPSQDHHQPQEAAAALDFRSQHEDKSGESWRKSGNSLVCNSLQMSDTEKSISHIPQTCSVHESPSEDLGSFCDDFSFEGVSADLEPNVSSLTSQENQTDWDKTDDEDEELGSYKHSHSVVNNNMENLRQFEPENGFDHNNLSAAQETPATSYFCGDQSHAGAYTEAEFSDFNHSSSEHQRDQDRVQTANMKVHNLGSLPLSDSFADFCSAPTQDDEEGAWVGFRNQRPQDKAKTWTEFTEQVSSLHTNGDGEDEQNRARQYGVLRRNSQVGDISSGKNLILF